MGEKKIYIVEDLWDFLEIIWDIQKYNPALLMAKWVYWLHWKKYIHIVLFNDVWYTFKDKSVLISPESQRAKQEEIS